MCVLGEQQHAQQLQECSSVMLEHNVELAGCVVADAASGAAAGVCAVSAAAGAVAARVDSYVAINAAASV